MRSFNKLCLFRGFFFSSNVCLCYSLVLRMYARIYVCCYVVYFCETQTYRCTDVHICVQTFSNHYFEVTAVQKLEAAMFPRTSLNTLHSFNLNYSNALLYWSTKYLNKRKTNSMVTVKLCAQSVSDCVAFSGPPSLAPGSISLDGLSVFHKMGTQKFGRLDAAASQPKRPSKTVFIGGTPKPKS